MSVQYRGLLSVAECLKLRARQCDDAIGAVRGADPRCDALRDAGRPLDVSRTCVEREATCGALSYARDADAPDHRRPVRLRRATRGARRAEDVRCDPRAPSGSKQAGPLPMEWRIDLGTDGRAA